MSTNHRRRKKRLENKKNWHPKVERPQRNWGLYFLCVDLSEREQAAFYLIVCMVELTSSEQHDRKLFWTWGFECKKLFSFYSTNPSGY
jgi:hypothetical protein